MIDETLLRMLNEYITLSESAKKRVKNYYEERVKNPLSGYPWILDIDSPDLHKDFLEIIELL